jgi:hypothetical protein
MWDDEGNEVLFDQSGNFRDQEEYERFVEEYVPLSSLQADGINDVANTINVDTERNVYSNLSSDDIYLRGEIYHFNTDFDARTSAIWHDRQSGFVYGNGHPSTCHCPECLFFDSYVESEVPYPNPKEAAASGRHPEDTNPQESSESSQSVSTQSASFEEHATSPDVSSNSPSSQIHMSGDPRRVGWFARLVRPWSWFRRQG